MNTKKFLYLLFTFTIVLNTYLPAGPVSEEERGERQTAANSALSLSQRRKLDTLQQNVSTRELARQFVAYFGIHTTSSYTVTNYLGRVLDSLSPAELAENSCLSFFTSDIFQRYIPQRTSEYTEADRQFAVCSRFEETLTFLRRLSVPHLQEVSAYVSQQPALLKSGSFINLFLFWYEKLPAPTRVQILNTLFTKFQTSIGYNNSPLRHGESFCRELIRISDVEKREKVLVLLTCGISNLFDFHYSFVERVFPILATLNLDEIKELQDFFAGERLKVLADRNLSLPVLEHLLRQEFRDVVKKNFLSEKVCLIARSQPRTKVERRAAMKILTTAQLMRCPHGQFFGLAEELNPDPETTKAVFTKYLQGSFGTLTDVMSEAPIRFYPLFQLALTMNPADFKTFLNPPRSPQPDYPEDDRSHPKEKFTGEFEYKVMMRYEGLWNLFSYPPVKFKEGQDLRFLAYLFYEDSASGIPRLRTPQEIKDRAAWVQSQDWTKTSNLEEVLKQIRNGPPSEARGS